MHETNIDYTHARMSILLKFQWSKISLASNLIGISTQPANKVLRVLDRLDQENSTYNCNNYVVSELLISTMGLLMTKEWFKYSD